MRRIIVHAALMAGGLLLLAGCGMADSHSSVRSSCAVKPANHHRPSRHPTSDDWSKKLDSVFVSTSNPRQVRVSPPRRDLHGSGWTACVRAELRSAMGKPLGAQTYRILISGGVIIDRRRVEADDNCASETYEPV